MYIINNNTFSVIVQISNVKYGKLALFVQILRLVYLFFHLIFLDLNRETSDNIVIRLDYLYNTDILSSLAYVIK